MVLSKRTEFKALIIYLLLLFIIEMLSVITGSHFVESHTKVLTFPDPQNWFLIERQILTLITNNFFLSLSLSNAGCRPLPSMERVGSKSPRFPGGLVTRNQIIAGQIPKQPVELEPPGLLLRKACVFNLSANPIPHYLLLKIHTFFFNPAWLYDSRIFF